jgi:hypothetical protein
VVRAKGEDRRKTQAQTISLGPVDSMLAL